MKQFSKIILAVLSLAFVWPATAARADTPVTHGPPAAGIFISVYQNQQHFAYFDGSGNIEDAFFDGSRWHLQKINNGGATRGPAAAGNPFVSVYQNQQHFAYLDGSGNIQDAFFDGKTWRLQKINTGGATAGPPASGNLFVSVYQNQQHFSYLDRSGDIEDAFFDGSKWHLQKINNGGATPGPSAAGNLFVSVYSPLPGPLFPNFPAYPPPNPGLQQHFSYLDRSGNIEDAFFDGSKWHLQKINNGGNTSGPAAHGSLFVSVYEPTPFAVPQQHFSYIDGSGNVQDAFFNGQWHLQRINNGGTTSGSPAAGSLFVSVYGDQQHFAYADAAGDLVDAFYDQNGNSWHLQTLNNGQNTIGPLVTGQIFASVYNNQQHFAYVDFSSSIQDAFYDGAWHLQQITTALPTVSGKVPLEFIVVGVVYAPPGTSAANVKNTVEYSSTSTIGTSSSMTSTSKQSVDLSVDAQAFGNEASADFSQTRDKSNTKEEDLSTSQTTGFTETASPKDGIDHSQDRIFLMLSPVIALREAGKNVAWSFSDGGKPLSLRVQWLQNPSQMPSFVVPALNNAGITPADYPTILARDPFANGSGNIDPRRFADLHYQFSYDDPGVSFNKATTDDAIDKSSSTSTTTDSFSIKIQGGFSVLGVGAKITNTDSFSWSNSTSYGISNESKQVASLWVAGPVSNWSGFGSIVDVYYDKIYGSFLFVFDPDSLPQVRDKKATVKGTLTLAGKPLAHEEVVLSVGGQKFITYTSSQGVYYFFRTPRGPATISVRKSPEPISIGAEPFIYNRELLNGTSGLRNLGPIQPTHPAAPTAPPRLKPISPGMPPSPGGTTAQTCSPSYPQTPLLGGTRVMFFTTSSPVQGAEVYLDGRCQGIIRQEAPNRNAYSLMVTNVPPGEHTVLIRLHGYVDFQTQVNVVASNQPPEQTAKVVVSFQLRR